MTDQRTRLGVDDWVDAALEIMADDGIAGVKIQRLCERLGVTKGSFYWHFRDLDAFLDAVADRWRRDDGFRSRMDDALRADPSGAFRQAVDAFLDGRAGRTERAMRDWSRSDARARAAIEAADRRTFDALVGAFRRLGFDRGDADVRAKILFYASVGYGDVGPIGDRRSPARQLETLIDLLTDGRRAG